MLNIKKYVFLERNDRFNIQKGIFLHIQCKKVDSGSSQAPFRSLDDVTFQHCATILYCIVFCLYFIKSNNAYYVWKVIETKQLT